MLYIGMICVLLGFQQKTIVIKMTGAGNILLELPHFKYSNCLTYILWDAVLYSAKIINRANNSKINQSYFNFIMEISPYENDPLKPVLI